MMINILILIIGIIIILLLANIIIKNSIKIAYHFNLSGTFIGLTILSIGTSIPEIMTHIIGSFNILRDPAAYNTLSSLLMGTNVGSDIFQETFVLGVVGLVGTIVVVRKNLLKETGGMIAAAALTLLFSLGGIITRLEGMLLLLSYVGYLLYLKHSKVKEKFNNVAKLTKKNVRISFLLISIGFIIMAFVANLVVSASVNLVELLPISASFFGIILLGIASALPELTTSLIAILKKKQDISAGILIGSNITNPLMGIGIGAMISTYSVPNVTVFYDLPFKILAGIVITYFLWKSEDLNKFESITLISLFILYLVLRIVYFPVDF
tara:strand:- start:14449 stop:15420 length:972 start_codon:yes stop_codon:yes gene_type:complete